MADGEARAIGVEFVGNRLCVDGDEAAEAVRFLFGAHLDARPPTEGACLHLSRHPEGEGYRLQRGDEVIEPRLDATEYTQALMQHGQYQLVVDEARRAMLHGAALAREGRGLLFAAAAGAGKTTLTSWLLGQSYDFLSDELAAIDLDGSLDGLSRPLNIKPGSLELLRGFPWLGEAFARGRESGGVTLLPWPRARTSPVPLRAILFPRYMADADFQAETLSPGRCAAGLMASLLNARNLPKHGLARASELARQVPGYRLTYSRLAEVSDWLERERPELG